MAVGPLTLLVGANASGKSNVRNAFQFLQGCALGYSLAEVIDEKRGPGGVVLWPGLRGGKQEVGHYGSDTFRLEVEIRMPTGALPEGERYSYSIALHLGGRRAAPRIIGESLRGATGEVFVSKPPAETANRELAEYLEVRFPGDADKPGDVQPRRYRAGSATLVQVAEDPKVGEGNRAIARAVVDVLRGMRFLELSPAAMREPSSPGHLTLGDRGQNLSSVLLGISEDSARKTSILGWLRALAPLQVTDLHFKEDFQGRILVHLVEADGHEISAFSASDGTLRFLALAAALLSPESGGFYFLEEIDNGIHPTRLHLLFDLLEQASRQRGCQVVATTHNPQLVSFLPETALPDAVFLYRREGQNTTQATRILDLPDIRRVLAAQDLGRLLATGWLEDTVNFHPDQDFGSGRVEPVAVAI